MRAGHGVNSGTFAIDTLPLNRPLSESAIGEPEKRLIALLAAGGDARIALDANTGLNAYLSAPYPRDTLAYSSSTVSDISEDAFARLQSIDLAGRDYSAWLTEIAARIRSAFGVETATRVVFAPSGTDLEYVALASVPGGAGRPIHNVLLGADEIGSGCVHSARGQYFADQTALGHKAEAGRAIAGFGAVSLVDIPVRCGAGEAQDSAAIIDTMRAEIVEARREGKHCLVHGVHGSKTGLVLPGLPDIAALQSEFGKDVTFVIDACQARITSQAISAYLQRGAIVLMTGSKFIGAPPFNGWALIPDSIARDAAPLPGGLGTVFCRAEWPRNWPGAETLPDRANLSLALRLEAAVFELERFQALPIERVEAIIGAFEASLQEGLIGPLGARRILPGGVPENLPIEMRTLATLDVSALPGLTTFDDAKRLHKRLALEGVRLGQPVKCVALPQGWGGTLRVGLSMPQMVRWAAMGPDAARAEIGADMRRIAGALQDSLSLVAS